MTPAELLMIGLAVVGDVIMLLTYFEAKKSKIPTMNNQAHENVSRARMPINKKILISSIIVVLINVSAILWLLRKLLLDLSSSEPVTRGTVFLIATESVGLFFTAMTFLFFLIVSYVFRKL